MINNKLNKKFIRVTYNNIGHYVQIADTLEQFKSNFIKAFNLDLKTKKFFFKCKDPSNRITKIEKEETFQKLRKYLIKYPKLIQPYFTSEDIIIHKNKICSGCGISPIEGIMYKCLCCAKFNLCQNCEKKYAEKHGHNLLVLRRDNYLNDLAKIFNDKLLLNKK